MTTLKKIDEHLSHAAQAWTVLFPDFEKAPDHAHLLNNALEEARAALREYALEKVDE